MSRTMITGDDAKRRIITYVSIMRHDYTELWQRYRAVVHENALLSAENDRLRRSAAYHE